METTSKSIEHLCRPDRNAGHDGRTRGPHQLRVRSVGGVFDYRQERPRRGTERMKGLGVDCLVPDRVKAARFAILPFRTATVTNPFRIIVPVVHYTNADPDTGKYQKVADGSALPIEWEIRYVELTRFELEDVKRLPDEGQTEYDIDIVLTRPNDTIYKLNRVYSKARWKQNPELAKQVEKAAAEASDALVAKLAGTPGVEIFDNPGKVLEKLRAGQHKVA